MTLFLIAIGVAMDCTAVSAAYALRNISRVDVAKLAITFGTFQCATSLLGALGGTAIAEHFGRWDGLIAFLILLGVSGHMLHEALFEVEDEIDGQTRDLSLTAILSLGVATSIDSLAVGATLPTLGLPILVSAFAIGIASLVMSFFGAWAAGRIGERLGPAVEIVGAVALIAIGLQALWTDFAEVAR